MVNRYWLLVILGLGLILWQCAGFCAPPQRSGVLFYAGFEGTADAMAVGDGSVLGHDGGPKFAQGKRGQALLSGDGDGYMSYAVKGNLLPERGTVEFWFSPQDWEPADGRFHVFLEAQTPGWLRISKHDAAPEIWLLLSEWHGIYDQLNPRLPPIKPGEWHHLVATWNSLEACLYLDGKLAERLSEPSLPAGLSDRFLFGDRARDSGRKAHTLLDELYIYDRALCKEEVAWAYEHALDRPPGEDVPAGLGSAVRGMLVTPLPSQGQLRVRVVVDSRQTGERFGGTVSLRPLAGTVPAPLKAVAAGKGEAVIPFNELPRDEYQVETSLHDEQGKEIGSASASLRSPGAPVWRGNNIGISDFPPPPWTPIAGSQKHIECWGRRYNLGQLGLPSQIQSVGANLLAAPVELRATLHGKPVKWEETSRSLVSKDRVHLVVKGSSVSSLGRLEWTCTAEFDGMLRYDLVLHPQPEASVDSMELRFGLRPEHAALYTRFGSQVSTVFPDVTSGLIPPGPGVVFEAPWMSYFWLGDEERGLAAFCESDEAWQRVDGVGFRMERRADSLDAIWSFADSSWRLSKPWKFTFGVQATPVKDISGWRRFRLGSSGMGQINPLNHTVDIIWPTPDPFRYIGYPEATHPQEFRAMVRNHHAKGVKVVSYSTLLALFGETPESLYLKEWKGIFTDTSCNLVGVSPTPDLIDFMVWANERFVRQMDLDGLYLDWTLLFPSVNAAAGCGYVRDGRMRPTFPIFATRQLYKRIYTMLKATGKDTFMMGHIFGQPLVPVLSFCDALLDGEQFRGGLRDRYYVQVMPLDYIRSRYLGTNLGVMPFFLPELSHEIGDPAVLTERTRHLVGLMLLHGFDLWAIFCNAGEVNKVYAVFDEFGIVAAKRVPYWKNADVITGQSEKVKCTAYTNPKTGALICLMNLTEEPQKPTVIINWARLGLPPPYKVGVMDAFTKETIPVDGNTVTVDITPFNYRLLWARSSPQRSRGSRVYKN